MSIRFDARQAFNNILSEMKTQVTHYTVTESYNSQMDLVKTRSSATLNAILEPVSELTSEGTYGRIVDGEFNMYVPYDTNIEKGDEIEVDSEKYQVQDITEGHVAGTVYTQCTIKKMS